MCHKKLLVLFLGIIIPAIAHAEKFVVFFQGVNQAQEQNIRNGLNLLEQARTKELTRDEIRAFYESGKEEIRLALQPFGFYDVQVDSQFIDTKSPLQITYRITLNRVTRVDKLHIGLTGDGSENSQLFRSINVFPLKKGDPFNHQTYESGKNVLIQEAINQGFIKAYFNKHQVVVDLSEFTADIDLSLDTGPQYHMGEIHFNLGYYDHTFLQRFKTFSNDDPYRLEEVVELESRLLQSNLFSSIYTTPSFDESQHSVPLNIVLEEAPANRYLVGAGYDTNTRLRGRLGWERKKVNPFGHQVQTHFKVSEKDTLLNGHYIIPGKKPWVDQYRFSLGYANEEYKDKPSELYTIEVSEIRLLSAWTRTLALRYLREDFKDSDFIKESSTFLLPSITFSRSKLDHVTTPRNGYRLQLSVRGGLDALLSDHDFIQFNAQYKWLKAISEEGTLHARTELGATIPNQIAELPLSIRFYAGGNDSIRGFRYRSLPNEIDKEGNLQPVGGAYLLLGSLEYDHTLWGPLKWAIFLDGGSALRKIEDDLQLGAGVGLRWQTPIGPIKLDVAKPLTNAAEVLRLHFSFGPEL
ncbi:MAG TPA: BamA/TamA family outer membrane protein [Gammaproteobacteria bacterium]|nr:BamA/TamA family outer membrane protein [Gammaproteobacteria bacterium]